jgi:hypothetical protein
MKTIHSLLLATSLSIVSCDKNKMASTGSWLSRAEVLEAEGHKRGEVFFVEGASGPYQFGSTAYGHAGSETSHQTFNEGGASFSFPKDDRFTYEATSYVNKDGHALIVGRRVPILVEKK